MFGQALVGKLSKSPDTNNQAKLQLICKLPRVWTYCVSMPHKLFISLAHTFHTNEHMGGNLGHQLENASMEFRSLATSGNIPGSTLNRETVNKGMS